MTEAAKKLRDELTLLPAEDRAELAHFLIHSLDENKDDNAEAAWEAELDRRVMEIQNGQAVGQPPNEVFDQLREKHS